MKGVRRMVVGIATTVLTLACQGCVQGSPHEYVRAEPAVAPSLGMTLAVPPAYAGSVSDSQTRAPSIHVIEGEATRFSGTPVDQAGVAVAMLLADAPSDFSVVSGFTPTDLTGMSWSDSAALVSVAAAQSSRRLQQPTTIEKEIAAELAISAPREATGLNFDVGLAPRLSVREDGDLTSQRVGGEVRIGRNLDSLKSGETPNGWYVFAGTDNEALVWDAGESGFRPSIGDMSLTDQVTVGDMQAGVSVQRAGGQLSLSYIRREVKYQDRNGRVSENEDFAGVSFTMRR